MITIDLDESDVFNQISDLDLVEELTNRMTRKGGLSEKAHALLKKYYKPTELWANDLNTQMKLEEIMPKIQDIDFFKLREFIATC